MVTGRGSVKAEYVQLALCRPLEQFDEYRDWREHPSASKKKQALEALLRNNRRSGQAERYHYLPGVFRIPHLIVDFQQINRVSHEALKAMDRLASLDSPYAEALLGRYNRYSGRFGTPDLDIAEVLRDLESQRPRETPGEERHDESE